MHTGQRTKAPPLDVAKLSRSDSIHVSKLMKKIGIYHVGRPRKELFIKTTRKTTAFTTSCLLFFFNFAINKTDAPDSFAVIQQTNMRFFAVYYFYMCRSGYMRLLRTYI